MEVTQRVSIKDEEYKKEKKHLNNKIDKMENMQKELQISMI